MSKVEAASFADYSLLGTHPTPNFCHFDSDLHDRTTIYVPECLIQDCLCESAANHTHIFQAAPSTLRQSHGSIVSSQYNSSVGSSSHIMMLLMFLRYVLTKTKRSKKVSQLAPCLSFCPSPVPEPRFGIFVSRRVKLKGNWPIIALYMHRNS